MSKLILNRCTCELIIELYGCLRVCKRTTASLFLSFSPFFSVVQLSLKFILKQLFASGSINANMADRSVDARHESHESEASQSSMFCCDNLSQKSESLALSSIWSALFRSS